MKIIDCKINAITNEIATLGRIRHVKHKHIEDLHTQISRLVTASETPVIKEKIKPLQVERTNKIHELAELDRKIQQLFHKKRILAQESLNE